jgi:hypothetical protein
MPPARADLAASSDSACVCEDRHWQRREADVNRHDRDRLGEQGGRSNGAFSDMSVLALRLALPS